MLSKLFRLFAAKRLFDMVRGSRGGSHRGRSHRGGGGLMSMLRRLAR